MIHLSRPLMLAGLILMLTGVSAWAEDPVAKPEKNKSKQEMPAPSAPEEKSSRPAPSTQSHAVHDAKKETEQRSKSDVRQQEKETQQEMIILKDRAPSQ